MLEWLLTNLGNIIVSLILIIAIFFVIYKMIKDKKAGKITCNSNCSGCLYANKCNKSEGKK